ncbi:putative GTP-binding protein 6 isoform X2 [Alexandromys fortis]|uniref:putative GTP-binding protein 6 isoform X2 n=1 Tax=Alexandromys fortis TaxID=100897 RepID=UPI0021536C9A|nr:putative GTP-binding protein 6 isoform X2 [Microtus fortis]
MCVFLNMERMTALTKKTLQSAWGVHVMDRFTIVLHILCCDAHPRKAWLQLALVELHPCSGCYPACEGHEPLQHGTTEARILSTLRGLQLRCRQDTLELHVGSLQQDGSGSWLQPPRTLHPGRVSALLGHGLDKLKATLEESVLQATGWRGLTLCLQLGRPQLCMLLTDGAVSPLVSTASQPAPPSAHHHAPR